MFNFSFNQLLEPNISLHQIYEPNKSVSFGRIFRLGRFGNRIFFPLIAFIYSFVFLFTQRCIKSMPASTLTCYFLASPQIFPLRT